MAKNEDIEISNEDNLLLLCAHSQINPEINLKLIKILEKDLDWDYLIQKAFHHKLLPLLYWNLKNSQDYIPEKRLNSLKENFRRNAQNNLLLLGELLKILALFDSEGITAVPYKGPVLSIYAYGELTLRQFGDLDIYIFKEDIFHVNKILVSQGYKPDFNIEDKGGNKYISSQRELKFYSQSKNITIEIHWKFSGLFFTFPKHTEKTLHENLKTIKIHNNLIITPSDEDLLLILCLHNASHRWTRLEWISDICELILKANIEWSTVIEKADKLHIKKILYINLVLAADLLDIDIPNDLFSDLNSDYSIKDVINDLKRNLLENNHQKGLLWEVKISLKLRESKIDGIKDILKGLMNPSFYEFNSFPLPYFLFPLYYLYRPINLINRFKLFK